MKLSKARAALLGRLHQRKQREREGCFVVEGIRSCEAALSAQTPVRFAVISPRMAELEGGNALAERLGHVRFDVATVDDAELARLAGTIAPQGVLMVCEEPRPDFAALNAGSRGLLLADAIQDPGNLGSMIRSAAAFGLSGLIALDGTVDPWNPKVVRGAAGASFRLPVLRASCDDALDWLADTGVRVLAADPEGEDVAAVDKSPPWAVAVGNEGAGLRREVRAAATKAVAVPLHPASDSLNAGVAAAVLCYELTRGAAA